MQVIIIIWISSLNIAFDTFFYLPLGFICFWLRNILQQRAWKCDRFDLFTFFRADLIQSEASWKLSSTSDWLISAWKNVS